MGAIFEGVKVKKEVVQLIKGNVKEGFYKLSQSDRIKVIDSMAKCLNVLYDAPMVKIGVSERFINCYMPSLKEIQLESPSIISFLHEYRHHLQDTKGLRYKDMTIEQDARAWSLRAFSLAVPKMFKKAVIEGKVLHIKYDEINDKIVDNASYI